GDSPADPNTEDTRCLPTQYLVAVATNQHEDKQQQCSETESQLQQQAKESRQPRQLKKKRIAECQLAKEGSVKKIQEVRDALCFAAEDAAAAASADGANVNEGASPAASVAVDFAIGSSFNSLSSGSSPRSVAADNTAVGRRKMMAMFVCQRQSELVAVVARSCRLDGQNCCQHRSSNRHTAAAAASDFSSRLCKRIQQQQQLGSVKNRVTQCSMDSGYQDTVCSSLTSLQQQHQHQPTPVPPFAVAVRESVAAASRTKQRRRSSSVGDLWQQLQEHLPAKDCSIVIDKPVESQRARAVTVEQCGPAQNTQLPFIRIGQSGHSVRVSLQAQGGARISSSQTY
uniref:CG8326 n=1 Tax=Macrostomum lignano TaxID=282301 RepID=A0A1I8JNJ9_9PLAT